MARSDITLVRGETLADIVFALRNPDGTAHDLTGWTARLDVTETTEVGCTVTTTVIITLSSTSGSAPRLVITALAGNITINATTAQTAAWTVGDHTYKLFVTDAAGAVRVAFEGAFEVRE